MSSTPYLTNTQAQMWMEHKPTNPLTGRKLKEGSPLYNRLDKMSQKLVGQSTGAARARCRKTWIKLTDDEASQYGLSAILPCKCGQWSFLNAIHTEMGDYECVRCKGDVDLKHFCYYCKNAEIEL